MWKCDTINTHIYTHTYHEMQGLVMRSVFQAMIAAMNGRAFGGCGGSPRQQFWSVGKVLKGKKKNVILIWNIIAVFPSAHMHTLHNHTPFSHSAHNRTHAPSTRSHTIIHHLHNHTHTHTIFTFCAQSHTIHTIAHTLSHFFSCITLISIMWFRNLKQ